MLHAEVADQSFSLTIIVLYHNLHSQEGEAYTLYATPIRLSTLTAVPVGHHDFKWLATAYHWLFLKECIATLITARSKDTLAFALPSIRSNLHSVSAAFKQLHKAYQYKKTSLLADVLNEAYPLHAQSQSQFTNLLVVKVADFS